MLASTKKDSPVKELHHKGKEQQATLPREDGILQQNGMNIPTKVRLFLYHTYFLLRCVQVIAFVPTLACPELTVVQMGVLDLAPAYPTAYNYLSCLLVVFYFLSSWVKKVKVSLGLLRHVQLLFAYEVALSLLNTSRGS